MYLSEILENTCLFEVMGLSTGKSRDIKFVNIISRVCGFKMHCSDCIFAAEHEK